MATSILKAKKVYDMAQMLGVDITAEREQLSRETVRRYCRMYKQAVGAGGESVSIADDGFIPRVLVFDIETSPNMAYVWKCFKEFVTPEQMLDHSNVLCYAAKWLGNDAIVFDSCQHDDDDYRVCGTLWHLFDQADVVVAHNGKAFDQQTMNTRWLDLGFDPPSPYKVVDTLKIAKAHFRFQMNRLNYIANYIGCGKKVAHEGFGLWKKVLEGDKAAWKKMEEYNIQDVLLLEEVYLKLRSWDKSHPNLSLLYDDGLIRCVCCGGVQLEACDGVALTAANTFDSFRCTDCGKVMRSRSPNKRETEVLATAI